VRTVPRRVTENGQERWCQRCESWYPETAEFFHEYRSGHFCRACRQRYKADSQHLLDIVKACPDCGGDTHITDRRGTAAGIRRRRECLRCGHRYTTLEAMVSWNAEEKRWEAA
jgi:hypothetical protein